MNQQQQQFALQQQQQQEYLFYQLMMRHQAALQAQQASLAAAGASGMRPGGSGMAGLPPDVTSQPMAAEALNMSFPSSSYPSPMAWAAPPAMPMTPRMVAALLGPGAGGGGADEHGGGAGAASAGSGSGSGMDMHGGVGMGGLGVGVGVGAGMGVGMGGMGTGRVPASSGDVTSVASTASGSLMSPHIAHGVPTPRMSTMGGVSSVNVGSYPQQVSHAMRGASMHGLSRGFGAGSVSAPSSVSTPATVAASAPGSAVMPAAPGRPGMRPPPVLTSLLPPAVARTRLSSTMRTPTAASVGIDVPSIGIGPEEFRNSIKKELSAFDAALDLQPVELAMPEELFAFLPAESADSVRRLRGTARAFFQAKVQGQPPQSPLRRDLAERLFVLLTQRMHHAFGSKAAYHTALLQAKVLKRAMSATLLGGSAASNHTAFA